VNVRSVAVVALLCCATILPPGCRDRDARRAKAGRPAPPLGLKKLLQAPQGAVASWEALKGKVVVLEFWATWCGPCVAAIPHFNELVEKYKDKAVQFISITDEEASIIEPFLKKSPIRGWVGVDPDRSSFKAFGLLGVPHTVVVDQKGMVAGVVHSVDSMEAILDDLLAGKSPPIPQLESAEPTGTRPALEAPDEHKGDDAGKVPPLLEVRIEPTRRDYSGYSASPGRLAGYAWSVKDALAQAYDVPEGRIAISPSFTDSRYDLFVTVPQHQKSSLEPLLQAALEAGFGLTIRSEKRETDVYVLSTGPGGPSSGLRPTASTGGAGTLVHPGRISFANFGIQALCDHLEKELARPVLDETSLEGRYDWELKYDPEKPQSLIPAVRDQLGLELTPARHSIEWYVVEKKQAPEDK